VPGENLLGGVEGKGFKQLMETFEARASRPPRAPSAWRNAALDLGMRYARSGCSSASR
jgi:(2S)-methylsuccinyl-CoA dehydrogenase